MFHSGILISGRTKSISLLFLLGILILHTAGAAETNRIEESFHKLEEGFGHLDAKLTRQMNELLWAQRLGDLAIVDKVSFTGPPPKGTNNLPAPSGSNEVIVSAMTFMPKEMSEKKLPLIVLIHGEIHGNVATDSDIHVVRELIEQGYAVIAPDYRGSSGYGLDYWQQIDYGGLEIEDVHAARAWMLKQYRAIDPKRVGIIGWSHGGMIALMTVFAHPESYQVCYAGVPVSDLEARIKIRGEGYERLFSAPYHLGKTVAQDPEEYRKRSPVTHVRELRTPLLIHANTNDEDVKVVEVEKLIDALKKEGKKFQSRIYTNAPGGHMFNRLDTELASESRKEIWEFLRKYLKPPRREKVSGSQ